MQPYPGAPATQQSYGQPQQGYGAPPPGGNPYAPPQGMPGGMPGGAMPGMGGYGFGQYEFNDMENAIIAKTAGRAKVWGIISIVIGALYLLSSLFFFLSPGLLANLAPGIGGIVVGITFVGVGNSLSSIVQTQGNDIEHMMAAMQKLGTAFMTQIIVLIVQVVLAIILMMIVFLFLAAMVAAGGP